MVWQGLLAKRAWLTGFSRTWQAERLEGCLTLASCDCICFTSLSANTDAKWPPWGSQAKATSSSSRNHHRCAVATLSKAISLHLMHLEALPRKGRLKRIHSNNTVFTNHEAQQHHTTTGKIAAKHKHSLQHSIPFHPLLKTWLVVLQLIAVSFAARQVRVQPHCDRSTFHHLPHSILRLAAQLSSLSCRKALQTVCYALC